MPITFEAAFRNRAIQLGGWEYVQPFPCPDLEGRVFWPEMPWHRPVAGLEVDKIRTAMLEEVDVPISAKLECDRRNYLLVAAVRGAGIVVPEVPETHITILKDDSTS